MARICEELRQLDDEGIRAKANALKKELFGLVYHAKAGRIEKSHRIRMIKRDIARCETVLREKRKLAGPSTSLGVVRKVKNSPNH